VNTSASETLKRIFNTTLTKTNSQVTPIDVQNWPSWMSRE